MSADDHDLGGLHLEEIPVAGPDHAFRFGPAAKKAEKGYHLMILSIIVTF